MKRTDLPDRFQKLLQRIPYATIATVCPDGQPWNSPVVGRFDVDMNLYWVSWKENQHSKNIAASPRIFVVVYDSQIPEGQGEGLYLQMRATVVDTAHEFEAAAAVYDADFFSHSFTHKQFLDSCPQRMYKAAPEHIWYNVDGSLQGHFIDTRVELTA